MTRLDTDYFGRKFEIIVRDLSCYTAQEMARELVGLAKVADENEAMKEANPAAQSVRDAAQPTKAEEVRDAARYRFMRDEATGNFLRFCPYGKPSEIDSAIDAAIASTTTTPKG